jgi:hypothetical protein
MFEAPADRSRLLTLQQQDAQHTMAREVGRAFRMESDSNQSLDNCDAGDLHHMLADPSC